MPEGGKGPFLALLAMGACCVAPLLLAGGGVAIASSLSGAPWLWAIGGIVAVGAVAWAIRSRTKRP